MVLVVVELLLATVVLVRSYTVAVDGPVVALLIVFVLVGVAIARPSGRAS